LTSLIFVDVALHRGGAVGQGQAGGDGLLVAADAAGEGAELGQVAGLGRREPALEFGQALAAGHDLAEGPDEAGEVVQVGHCAVAASSRAWSAGSRLSGWVSSQRVAAAVGAAELADVAPGGLDAAGPAPGGDLAVQGGGAGDALVPALADPGLERVELPGRWP
jgi:hypothetical protein